VSVQEDDVFDGTLVMTDPVRGPLSIALMLTSIPATLVVADF
jgi:hypothetical protein